MQPMATTRQVYELADDTLFQNEQVENQFLIMKIKYLEELLLESQSKNKILIQNNELLLEKIQGYDKKTQIDNNRGVSERDNILRVRRDKNSVSSRSASMSGPKNVKDMSQKPSQTSLTTSEVEVQKHNYEDIEINTKRSKSLHHMSISMNEMTSYVSDEQWKIVERPKKQIKKLICTGLKKTDGTINFQGAQRKKWVYVGRIIEKEVSETTIESYIKGEVQGDIEVKKLETKGQNSAFSVGFSSTKDYKRVCCPDFWPEGVVVREFSFRNFFSKTKIQPRIE
ncbi:hypothetical protein WA026_007386 [Henosepilachna vigintioctopunctata]|uniref:Uncharacterized protein n=1 Tax=Henosepilachna vigintioctopunctata TaxID=420089 RepID=A0AAW1UUL7_9CUCU